jgi:hypothetical protein
MTERQHIYEDLNKSSSAGPGGSQQLEILPSPNSKPAANFSRSADISPGVEISMPAKILSSAYISARRQHFTNPPTFCASANILEDSNILGIRQYFHETPIF